METLLHALPKSPAYEFVARCVGAVSVLSAYFVLVRLGEGRSPTELSLVVAPREIIFGLATGSTMFAIVIAILAASGLYNIEYHGAASLWNGAGLAIQSGVLEEIIVRGVILRVAWRAAGPIPAFIFSSFLFGVGHIFNPGANIFTTACVAIEAGIMLGSFYAMTGRLWVSIGVHVGWNFTQGFLFGAAVSGGDFGQSILKSTARTDVANWLTGGAFGPEATLPALLICTAVGVIALLSARQNGQFETAPPSQILSVHPDVPPSPPSQSRR